MWKRACEKASKSIAEAKDYNKKRYDKTHMELDFTEGDQVLVSTLNLSKLKGPKKTSDSFVGPFTILKLIGRNAVETGRDKFPSRKNTTTPPEIVEVEDSPAPVKKIRLNGEYQRKYLVRFENQTADKDKWLAEDFIPDGNLHLRRFRASRRT
ncbi:hypothetical protein O181_024173 [Austropuccinia psidii MF-1]|uniref:Chromo domain-containing protein n=1 Tax=Austropuccinia psidii MF-1 TaxID=1389203 RepID=A0A9Q3CIF9_9BASI|nr:hypothetical protein [Austropuccinia psidii MF-1]